MEDIRAPWDIQAVERLKNGSKEIGLIRDDVIMDWLRQGDPRPYCDWVLNRKHRPSMRVAESIAFMMVRAIEGKLEAKYDDQFPFSLEIGNRAANRMPNPETEIKHWLIGRNVARLMDEGMKYKTAIAAVEDFFKEEGAGVSKAQIESAYSKYKNGAVTLNK